MRRGVEMRLMMVKSSIRNRNSVGAMRYDVREPWIKRRNRARVHAPLPTRPVVCESLRLGVGLVDVAVGSRREGVGLSADGPRRAAAT